MVLNIPGADQRSRCHGIVPGVETWRSSLPRHNNCSETKVQTAFNAFNKCNYVWQPTLSCRSTFLSQNERKLMQHFGLECVSCHVWCEPNSCARARATRCHSVTHERYGCTTLVALLDLPVGVSDSTEDNVYSYHGYTKNTSGCGVESHEWCGGDPHGARQLLPVLAGVSLAS